ncbi:MAG: DUF4236 domain-containing protein [Mesorhizobium sp.]|uniref:DUF4236 domain-containing protein n=1 Tax=Mesorhizobium sp. TaxID=1871066 RepID=UPI000FEAA479|nr:DUF4236 domain-containing protein [Mesorhizobium sp.]RWD31319.1 MAG: DUF4236 domain-containing protein [Mesorhizobium sp.]TJW70767.1 MAG: DUF4236 domain-containing protein [Mesorhizobium sp.]
MGWRFRKSIRLVPGVRLNIGKKSMSVSAGPRGFKTTIGTAGRTTTVGIPGTGISHTSRKAKGRRQIEAPQLIAQESVSEAPSPRRRWIGWAIVLFVAFCLFARFSG